MKAINIETTRERWIYTILVEKINTCSGEKKLDGEVTKVCLPLSNIFEDDAIFYRGRLVNTSAAIASDYTICVFMNLCGVWHSSNQINQMYMFEVVTANEFFHHVRATRISCI